MCVGGGGGGGGGMHVFIVLLDCTLFTEHGSYTEKVCICLLES